MTQRHSMTRWFGRLGLSLSLVGLISYCTLSAQTPLAETRQRADQGDAGGGFREISYQTGDDGVIFGNLYGEGPHSVYRHGFLGQPGECIHAAGVSANARRTTAGARKPSRSINH